jgi:hypothetical protein
MPEFPFPSSSTPGALPGEGEGRIINAHVTKEGDRVYLRPAPGLAVETMLATSGPRGLFASSDDLFVAAGTAIYKRNQAGMLTTLTGAVPGADQVTFARNMRQTPGADIAVARSSGGAYFINPTTNAVATNADADLPATVNSVSYLGGAFVYTDTNSAKIWASDVNATSQDALAFASAETKPDRLIRGVTSGNAFLAMGTDSIEPWLNVGTTPFPLSRHTTVIPVGLLAFGAVAGDQAGWDGPLLWVAGDATVRQLNGYTPAIVSTRDVERFIASSATASLRAFVYVAQGAHFWVLTSDKGTWDYNVDAKSWTERQSAGQATWRALHSAKSGSRWYFGDTLSAALLRLDEAARTEAGAAMTVTMESGALQDFPARVAIPAGFFRVTPAAGNVLISWSHDGGQTWQGPVTRSLADVPVRVNRLGLSTHHGLRVRLVVSDPVAFSFQGASVPDAQQRAA